MDALFNQRIRLLSKPMEPRATELQPRLPEISGIRAVIFDVYGTCFISGSGDIGVSTADPKTEALVESLKEQGVELPPDMAGSSLVRFYELIENRHQDLKGAGTAYPEIRILDIWEQWRREFGLQVDVPQLAIDVECRINPVWPMPGLIHALEQLQAGGVTLGIVSNAQVFTPCLFSALAGHGLADLGFSPGHCVWSWRLQEAKPSPRLYEILLESLEGMAPHECLYVGNDMRNDIAPAAKVGMRTALFAGDARSLRLREGDPLVGEIQPDVVVTALSQIPGVFS
ncbi:MAG: HAD hydrolase-like protein [Verrucomicrobia bacterium]|nr:HAD hydrolase-like protein [Verrucomicrobiota bacterium]MCH8511036.1 HAD family hydrolase [Kiritimatiellia bacterium]